MKFLLLPIISLLLLSSCKKVEGEGGTSTIKGKIIENRYSSVGSIIATYDAADQDVFIIYGDGSTYFDDKIATSYDGTFEFRYLQKGSYTIFVYEDCNTCPSGKSQVILNTKIEKKKSTVDLGTMTIKKY